MVFSFADEGLALTRILLLTSSRHSGCGQGLDLTPTLKTIGPIGRIGPIMHFRSFFFLLFYECAALLLPAVSRSISFENRLCLPSFVSS